MSIISPIVGISKIISQYTTFVVGFDGVIYDGKEFDREAIKALTEIKRLGKNVILLTNSAKRIKEILKTMQDNGVSSSVFSLIMTAGEMMHYIFRNSIGRFPIKGKKYFQVGAPIDKSIMANLKFERVNDINSADFLFIGGVSHEHEKVEQYHELLECAAALDLPLVCVGNDVVTHINGEICDGSGLFAEQYAMMGGKIYTFGKPDINVLKYVLEDFESSPQNTLIIGDSLQTDIKMANLFNADSVLVTKGVHKEILGDGYIPDLQKAKDLSSDYGSYPKYLISELRW